MDKILNHIYIYNTHPNLLVPHYDKRLVSTPYIIDQNIELETYNPKIHSFKRNRKENINLQRTYM